MAILLPHTTRTDGVILTANIYNSDHLTHIVNMTNINEDVDFAQSELLRSEMFPAFRAGKSQNQEVTDATSPDRILCDQEIFDIGGSYSHTSSFWLPPAGQVIVGISISIAGVQEYTQACIYKNGAPIAKGPMVTQLTGSSTDGRNVTVVDSASGLDVYEAYLETADDSVTIAALNTYFWGAFV